MRAAGEIVSLEDSIVHLLKWEVKFREIEGMGSFPNSRLWVPVEAVECFGGTRTVGDCVYIRVYTVPLGGAIMDNLSLSPPMLTDKWQVNMVE